MLDWCVSEAPHKHVELLHESRPKFTSLLRSRYFCLRFHDLILHSHEKLDRPGTRGSPERRTGFPNPASGNTEPGASLVALASEQVGAAPAGGSEAARRRRVLWGRTCLLQRGH